MAVTLDTRVGWVSLKEVLDLWADAPGEPDEDYAPLPMLLDVAHGELARYAPASRKFVEGQEPAGAKLAQVLLTQHLWARKRSGDGDGFGPDGFQLSTYPLVMEAKDKMKPYRGQFRGLR